MTAGLYVIGKKVITGDPVFLAHGPLLLLSAVLVQSGILLVGLGVLAEILTRIYFDGRHRRIYTIDRVVAQPFVALAVGRPNVHDLDRSIPVGCGRHRTMVGPEADEIGVFSVRRPAKTADISEKIAGMKKSFPVGATGFA